MKDKTKNVIFSALAMALLLSLALAASAFPGRAESDQPDQVNYAYLPSVYSDPPGSLITGQVTSLDGVPIPGVTVTTQTGLKAVTDSEGIYIFKGLREDVYTLTPALSGMSFTPPSSQAVVPPKVLHMNFASIQACQDVIKNGGFESNSDWEFPITEYPAAYSSADAHTGSRSARTGITNPSDNKYSYSSIRQAVDIPSDATGAMLRLYLHPESGEFISGSLPLMPTGVQLESQIQAGDVQYVLVLDAYNNILETLFWGRFDTGWGFYEFNLIKWAGRTIKIHIGTYNDGLNGITAMYVDDVSMQLCSDGTPPPTTPPPSGACNNLISNSSFESISTWDIPITAYPAGYATAQAHTGSQSMRTGIINSADNRYSYSDFRQLVSIPSSFNPAILRLWTYTLSGEARSTQALPNSTPTGKPFGNTPLAGDVQYLLILDRYQNWIDTLLWQREDEGGWLYYEFDLRKYAGQTIYIQFGTYNDGWNGISAMYIDDVTLENCTITPTAGPSPTATRTPTATPTPLPTNTPTPTNTPLPTNTPRPTNTPGPCEELFDNVDFEDDDGWEIPITRYTAGYSTVQALSPIHSMRTGIVNPVDNTYSYSDFRQTVAIPLDADNVILGVWLYTLSGEVAEAPIPPIPNWERFGEEPLAGDVQYILILDRYGYWIDTLYWDRSDDGGWVYHEFDLSDYAGWVISVQFGTYNDGYSGVTAMYVDDASLGICP